MKLQQQKKIQDELKNGKTITEICTKYNITLKELIKGLKKNNRTYSNHKLPKYIRKINKKYSIVKTINGKQHYYGTYNTLEDATLIRDNLIKFNWDKDYLKLILRQTGVNQNGS